jgi:hypothetical protein
VHFAHLRHPNTEFADAKKSPTEQQPAYLVHEDRFRARTLEVSRKAVARFDSDKLGSFWRTCEFVKIQGSSNRVQAEEMFLDVPTVPDFHAKNMKRQISIRNGAQWPGGSPIKKASHAGRKFPDRLFPRYVRPQAGDVAHDLLPEIDPKTDHRDKQQKTECDVETMFARRLLWWLVLPGDRGDIHLLVHCGECQTS